jgi:PAS domain S-box-containing protein
MTIDGCPNEGIEVAPEWGSGSGTVAAPGVEFVLAAGGLRNLNAAGEGFLGYGPEEIFWRDALELVAGEDRRRMEAMISFVKNAPGASLDARLSFRDPSGARRPVEVTVQNVVEVPGDGGLLVVNIRELDPLPQKPEDPTLLADRGL